MTMKPTTTLSNADACPARLAPKADCAPIRLPTRVDAATQMPNGRVFKTVMSLELRNPNSCL